MPQADVQDFFIQWHLTERCNLRCAHCYQDGKAVPELAAEEAKSFAAQAAGVIAAWGAAYGLDFRPSCNLTGGEPLLRADLFEIIEVLARLGFEVFVLTNGLLVDERAAGRLRDAGVAGVQVSMEGPKAVHEAIRGPGSFEPAARGVRHLVRAGLPVTVNATLCRINAAAFAELLPLARDLGAMRLGFSRLVPAGRGLDLAPEALSAEEVREAYLRIVALKRDGVELVSSDPLALRLLHPGETPDLDVAIGGCAAGVSGLTVLADGTLVPCRRLPIALGNVRTADLREVWACSTVLAGLRDRNSYGPKCRGCPEWAVCRGCRAVAHALTGDFLADDPHCFLRAG